MAICHKIYPYRVVLKLSWYSQGLNFTNGIIILNHEFVYHKIFEEFRCYSHAKYAINILKKMYTTYSIYGVSALFHQCECMSTKITSITEECLSRNRRIAQFVHLKRFTLTFLTIPLSLQGFPTKIKVLCHSMCDTIKTPPCWKTSGAEHKSISSAWWRLHMSEIFSSGTWNNSTNLVRNFEY